MEKVLEALNTALSMKDHDIDYWKNKAYKLEAENQQLKEELDFYKPIQKGDK